MTVDEVCAVLEKMEKAHAVDIRGDITWLDAPTIQITAKVIRAVFGECQVDK